MNLIKNLLSPYKGLPREIYILFIAKIVNAVGCFVGPLLTLILTQKIGLANDTAGLYMSILGFIYIPSAFIGGKLTDTLGRKKIIIIFEALSAILYISCGFLKPSIYMVYILMAASSCMGIAGPAHDSFIADLTEPKNRNAAYALGYMGWNIGFAVGPILGGLLFKNHLSWVFIGDALTALIALSLVLFFTKETIHLTKNEINDDSRELEKREEGSIFKVLLKRPILIYFALIIFGYNFVYSQWDFMFPLHVNHSYINSGAKYYGYLASANGLVVMLFTPLVTKLNENTKNIRSVLYGGLLYALGFGMLGFINTLPFFFLSVFIFTLGEIVLAVSITPFIMNHTPISHRGRMSGILPVLMGFGHTLSPLVIGNLLMHTSIQKCWFLIGGIALISSFFMKQLERYDNKTTKDSETIPLNSVER